MHACMRTCACLGCHTCVCASTDLAVCLSKWPLRDASHCRWPQVWVMLHVVHKCTDTTPDLPMLVRICMGMCRSWCPCMSALACKGVPNHNEHCWRQLCELWIRHCHCQTAAQMVCSVVACERGLACDGRPLRAHKQLALLARRIVHSCALQQVTYPLHEPLCDVQLICHMHAACMCLLPASRYSPHANSQPNTHAPTWDECECVQPLLCECELCAGASNLIPAL